MFTADSEDFANPQQQVMPENWQRRYDEKGGKSRESWL
ncbi:hypothetical protein M2403_002776 [Rahnella sp. BIGb0603]|jgi:hypothetical protein|nr:hypothetical protein [Rahnella sp. BIGb0603]